MSTTDVHLPGALPLVLERTHLSSYRHGVWFGPTWASTLDQRLQLDNQGVVFAAADGMRLEFPPPRPDAAVLPYNGPQFRLTWNGIPGAPMQVHDPFSGRMLEFHGSGAAAGLEGAVTLRLTAMEDRNGRRIEITWADDGTPALITHHGGYRIAVDRHPELPRITALRLLDTDGPGTQTVLARYGYDDRGDLVEVFSSSGLPALFRYDDQHRITGWTDRNGTAYAYEYDGAGRVVRTTGSDGILSNTFAYDDETRTTTFTDALGNSFTYQFNEAYRLVRTTDATGAVTVQEWDADGRLRTAVTDPIGRTSRFTYDEADNLTVIGYPDGSSAAITYNRGGLPVEMTDPAGRTWRSEYDERGNLVASTDPMGARTEYAYNERGDLVSVTDPLGARQELVHNAAGLPIAVTDVLGRVTTARRDAFGRITQSTDALGGTVRFGFTVEGQVLWCERSDGRREEWTYDPEGNALTHTDATGRISSQASGHFGLTSGSTDTEGVTYTFTHDAEQRLTAVTNPLGHSWSYEYDPMGRLVRETDFGGRTLSYTYDAAGQLTSRTNGAGETVTFTHDVLGRLIEYRDADDATVYSYDAAGNLERSYNGHAEIVREHDLLGRILAETVNGHRTSWTYDLLGRPTERRTPTGIVSTWTYDAASRPQALGIGGHRTEFGHDELGREISRTIGDLVLQQSWDSTGRLTGQSVLHGPAGPGLPVQRREYGYRADDFLTEIRDLTTGTCNLTVDRTGRVTAVQARGWSETYAYDSLGNLTHAATPLARPEDAEREFTGGRLRRAGHTWYEYDAQGRTVRTTRRLLNGQRQVRTFAWNAHDQLTATVTPDGTRWTYLYDPAGRRIAKQRLDDDGTIEEEIRFTWSGAQLAERTETGGHITTWEYAPGTYRPLAQLDHEPGQDDTLARFHAIVTDPVGTPTELITADGEVAWQQRTTLWGVPATDPAGFTVDCPLRFPGQYADPETGWNFNYFRHYDPQTARYVTPDPLGLDPAPNAQAYVANPFAWIDPLGLDSKYKDLPGWKEGEPIDTSWGGRVTYSPLDEHNRPGAVTAEIHKDMLGQNTGPKINKNSLSGWDANHDLERGHLLAAQLGGSNTIPENFVALHEFSNSPIMRHYENQVREAVGKKGHIVTYTVTPIYRNAEDLRPVGLTIHATSPQGFAFSPHSSNTKQRRAWRKNPDINTITILNTCR
ncbi:MAG: DNA/RNA non-specific endonuclease [Streptomycetaceae bacterium]|nr:DNA/RNA non-specific endonuclease [Streptomycetaceae bacterium]